MSLYIRTKMFQILEVTKKEEDTSYKDVCYWYKCKRNRYKMNSMHSDFVIKESQNLEDLCDEFILVDDNSHTLERDLKELTRYKKYVGGNYGIVYGAIWTYEGLIYVAKINKDGEWELI